MEPELRRTPLRRLTGLAALILALLLTTACTPAGNSPTSPNGTVQVSSPRTVRQELSVEQAGKLLTGSFDGVGSARVKGYLVVRNDTDETLVLFADFIYQDAEGNMLERQSDTFQSVAPGTSALLFATTDAANVARVTFELRSEKSNSSKHPIGNGVIVEKSVVLQNMLTLAITNDTDERVELTDVRIEISGKGGMRRAGQKDGPITLRPGKRSTVQFEPADMFEGELFDSEGWENLTCSFYLNGYSEASEEVILPEVTPGDAERVPSTSLEISHADESLSGSFDGAGPKGVKAYLLVRNTADTPVALNALFTYWKTSGEETRGYNDSAEIVAPGETVMLCAEAYDNTVAKVDYTVQAHEPESWAKPLKNRVELTEVAVNDKTVRIRITNTSPDRGFLGSVRCLATDAEGRTHGAKGFSVSDLPAGESVEISFARSDFFDPGAFLSWEGLERTYYITGHAS